MKKILAAITVAATLIGSGASAYNPVHLKKLEETNKCVNCDLSGADLRGSILNDANLLGANLRDADLEGVNLDGANLGLADLRGVNLDGASLRDAKLHRARMKGAVLCNTTMPNGWVEYGGC